MKLYLHELKDMTSIDWTLDLHDHLQSTVDILSIKPAHVTGDIIEEADDILFRVHVSVSMELACAKTLKPVPYALDFDADIVFGASEDADYPLTNPLDISDVIFGYILSEKPYTIYHPDAKNTSFDEEKRSHPAFADLDKTFKT